MTETTIDLGPRASGGKHVTVVRCYDDVEPRGYTAVIYELHGVESISAQTPYDIGGGVESVYTVEFINGKEVRVEGAISEL